MAVRAPAVTHREDLVPTYQYACTVCDHRFEAVQSFTEDSLTVCPECTGRLRKVYANVGVVFKGSGFYRNDSRAPEPSNGSGKESGKDAGKDTSTEKVGAKDGGGKDAAAKDAGSNNSGTKAPAGTGANGSSAKTKGSGTKAGAGRSTPSTGSGSAA